MKATDTQSKTELLALRIKQLKQINDDIERIEGYLSRADGQIEAAIQAYRPDEKEIAMLKYTKKSQQSELYLQKCDQDIVSTEIKILEMELNDKGLQVLD